MTIEITREAQFSQQISTMGIEDGVSYRLVYGWRKASRGQDWQIRKTVVTSSGEITAELSETEVSQLPFKVGYLSIYRIDSISGKKIPAASYDIRVIEGVDGSDYTSTSNLQTAVPYSFTYTGGAQIDFLNGFITAEADGYLTKFNVWSQEAPLGSSLIYEIYINDEATGVTIEQAAGDRDNTATIDVSVAQDDEIKVRVIQVGDIGTGVAPTAVLNYQAS